MAIPQAVPGAVGVLYYEGFTFPATATIEPTRRTVLSEDKNTYVGSEFEITATCLVTHQDTYPDVGISPDPNSTDALVSYLRKKFSKLGGVFLFADHGYGTICLNGPVNIGDKIAPSPQGAARTAKAFVVTHTPLEAGPVVDLVSCEFTGYNKSVLLKVTFKFTICDCCDNEIWDGTNTKVMEMSLSRSWTVNEAGFVVRSTKGKIRYWVVLDPAGTVIVHDYGFISSDVVPPLPGYQREQSFTPDIDGRGFTFQITDIPIESPLPYPAIMRVLKFTHTIGSGLNRSNNYFNIWDISFNFEVEVLQDTTKLECLAVIGQLMLERMQNVLGAGPGADGWLHMLSQTFDNKALMMNMRISDEVTSNRFTLDVDWRATFSIDKLTTVSKILSRPTAAVGQTWPAWSAAMGGIQGFSAPYVEIKTKYYPVAACGDNAYLSKLQDLYNYPVAPPFVPPANPSPGSPPTAIGTPYTNYYYFSNKHRIQNEPQNFRMSPGFGNMNPPFVPRNGNDAGGGNAPPGTGLGVPSASIYKAGPTKSTYVMHGESMRAGAYPAVPTLVTYDGTPMAEIGKSAIELGLFMTAGGVPIYTSQWYLAYEFPNEIAAGVNPFALLSVTLTEPQVYGSIP